MISGKLRGRARQPEPKQQEGFSTHARQVRFDYHGTFQLVCLEEHHHFPSGPTEKIERVVLEIEGFRGGANLSPAQGAMFWALVGLWVEGLGGVEEITNLGWTPG